ncbi:MAG: ATP-binding protein, partial [Candidatus Omnitrophota bacterium]
DNGLGIARDEIIKIFERFYRADRENLRGTKGSGLGLAFVRSVVEAHKGKIAVMSDLGRGSKFTISLPIEKA